MTIVFHRSGLPNIHESEEVEIVHSSTAFTLAIWCLVHEYAVVEHCLVNGNVREHAQGYLMKTYNAMSYLLDKQPA